ncbi:alternative ribosome rescue aminoacyl-tRNA hydrolase ArfB [Novosphingopyxis sp. YJ-S2-01]|uniref:alternative ribosome rescue aminoacyl-tRNA hydrolase ArfB n=1 Tax=Novosphingopyxis sp. YJ-S2-01 TaxID=2794021 RepID=UPI0018DB62DA|nr:alternative ribosome rescue aminoacyl-tRNA hydrolase ArfB [Novosphingopyxis sp. YJ-S2-01]MBH9536210.1 aminoacyl-tRNA hydrolase [Novosphingopyxis sp. YJ-S2-01]|tara:strand:- start:741 stop:1136 length:396 start_codon:yes stop_codon:yes gene_type:complete
MRVPEEHIEESFLAGSGPGGQNVNKVETAAQLRVNIFALGLQPYAYRQLKDLAGSKLTKDGVLVITARTHRTREANREEARRRLDTLLTKAHQRDAKRRKTKPSRAAKARRVDTKKKRSAVKEKRGRVRFD